MHLIMVRVLLAQFALETHSRGMLTIAQYFRDAGAEVILLGNGTPQHIINAAIQEGVDVIGISTYCGGEVLLGQSLIAESKYRGVADMKFIIGGVFPQSDVPKLYEIGFNRVFLSASRDDITSYISSIRKG